MQRFAVMFALAAFGCSGTSFTGSTSPTQRPKSGNAEPTTAVEPSEDLGNQSTDDKETDQGNNEKKKKKKPEVDTANGETCKTKTKTTPVDDAQCAIVPNGNQAVRGVYAVILTKPAPCDFRLPTVSISGRGFKDFGGPFDNNTNEDAKITVPVGTYWAGSGFGGFGGNSGVAHSFALSAEPANAPRIDNGFILVQPGGKSYLLVDGGSARPGTPEFQDAARIANQVSASLGYGATTLAQPTATTTFKTGAVIAIYDDTPDMAGSIDVQALVASRETETACE